MTHCFELKFRVWHIPQVPMKSFFVEVPTYDEAVRIQNALAGYDMFQFENNIKPDYCNASGIQFYDHTLSDEDLEDTERSDRWVDIENESDLNDYLEEFKTKGFQAYHKLPTEALEAGAEVIFYTRPDELSEGADAVELLTQKVYDAIRFYLNSEQE